MSATVKYLSDYRQPNYWIGTVDLTFEILPDKVVVISKTTYTKNPTQSGNSLTLNGSSKLIRVQLDGQDYANYQLRDDELLLNDLADNFSLTILTEVDPYNNKSCMGLYASNGNLFTQCEPEGFRKITYYLDRPDVMAKFTTTIIASPQSFPVLLANGNKISDAILSDGRNQVVWEDPFKKPSYLFALVAGKFAKISSSYQTKSQKSVLLEVYSEANSIDQCYHCLESLKKAMIWDEERFNLEYDLDRYMIVASSDFNMGAMENKGLNIFNTKYVLANSATATDSDFINVEAVVGHEYFHNWTGNRVTCRDWFQLSLKEGLTVFRDQEFTADLHSRQVKRIQDVKLLRQNQFPEDASPLAHPVRPSSYIEMNNFYTVTVYEKGAEVVRMYQVLLGKTGFNLGMQLYFNRHDGGAVTCDEFCQAMADANSIDLSQFMLWYSQAGTPTLKVSDDYNSKEQQYTLKIEQILPPTPDLLEKQPMLIPLQIALFSNNGDELPLELISGSSLMPDEKRLILLVNQNSNRFIFKAASRPTPSLLRDFSAPVKIDYPFSQLQLLNLAAHDSDAFNRWEAMQTLYIQVIKTLYSAAEMQAELIPVELIQALKNTLSSTSLDPSMRSLIASLPSFAELTTSLQNVNVARLNQALNYLRQQLANKLEASWWECYKQHQTRTYQLSDANLRALKNTALNYLLASDNYLNYLAILERQYQNANNMTDKLAALIAINDLAGELRSELLTQFNSEFKTYPLVMDKWFSLQSSSQLTETLTTVKKLTRHPDFDQQNPNKLYALIRAFSANSLHFNTKAGYQFISSEILRIDKFNPGVASRIAQSFGILSSLAKDYQELAKPFLAEILTTADLSKDVYEIISKTHAGL